MQTLRYVVGCRVGGSAVDLSIRECGTCRGQHPYEGLNAEASAQQQQLACEVFAVQVSITFGPSCAAAGDCAAVVSHKDMLQLVPAQQASLPQRRLGCEG